MNKNNIYHTFQRLCLSALAGFTIPIIIGVLSPIVFVLKNRLEILGIAVFFVMISAIPSTIAGIIGGTVRRCDRACAYGTMIFLTITYFYFNYWFLWIISIELDLGNRNYWMPAWIPSLNIICFTALVGALAGEAGAVVGRTVPKVGEEMRPMRLSLRESTVVGLLIAIILFYIFLMV